MEAMINTILEYAVIYAPGIAAVLGCIISYVKSKNVVNNMASKFEEVRSTVAKTKEYEELKAQLNTVYNENIELRKKLNQLLTKIDKIARKDDE